MDIARGGDVAERVSRTRIAQPGEDVPRRGDGKEQQNTGEQAEFTPAAPIAGEQQVRARRQEEEDRSDESLGEHGQASAAQVR